MSEWFKEHAWNACVGETLPRVRIPLSPPFNLCCAKRGVSGALYLQSAIAGSNSLNKALICGVCPLNVGVDNRVPRNGKS